MLDGGPRWDVLQLSQMPGDSSSREKFEQFAAAAGRQTGVWESGAAPYLQLSSTWDAYLNGLSSKFRQNLRNRLGRLSQIGEPTLEVLDDAGAIRAGRADAQRLEDSGWKATEGTAIASDESVQRFYTLMTERADECPWLRLLFLSVGGRRIATSLRRGVREPAVPAEDRVRPGIREVLALQDAHVLRAAARVRAGLQRIRFSWRHRAVEARVDLDDAPARLAVRVCRHAARPAPSSIEIPSCSSIATDMFIPTFQGLTATDFVLSASGKTTARRYPFDVPHLTFYRARNAIYHLFKVLKSTNERLTVLVPDYNSGNEVLALEAAGATIRYYPVGPDGQADAAEVERLCAVHHPDVLYVIHYLGWPQPIRQFADLARRRGMWLVEDCALALLSDAGEQPLGTFGHFSVFCLYKTLPLPNGACLVENGEHLAGLDHISLRQAGLPSVLGRTAELVVRNIRSRSDSLGAAMESMKRAAGRAVGAMDVPRAKIGDIGFNIDDVDLAMSEISARLLKRLDFEEVRNRRIDELSPACEAARRTGHPAARRSSRSVSARCCFRFSSRTNRKRQRSCEAAASTCSSSGITAPTVPARAEAEMPPNSAQYLRRHVLGLPIHQDLTDRHIDYVAEQVARLNLRMS